MQQSEAPIPAKYPQELDQLGVPQAVFGPSKRHRIWAVVAGVVIIAFGLLVIGYVLPGGEGNRRGDLDGRILLGGAFMLGGVVYIGVQFTRIAWAGVSESGLVYIRRGDVYAVRWADVSRLYQKVVKQSINGIPTGTYRTYTVQDSQGQSFIINNLVDNVDTLWKIVQQQVTNRLFPKMLAEFEAGRTLSFGKLSISNQGISNGREHLPWDAIKGVRLLNGMIYVDVEGKRWRSWAATAIGDMPNPMIFLTLTDHIVGVNRKGR